MKHKVYMRLARNPGPWKRVPYKVDASLKPNARSLTTGSGTSEEQLHTLHFALNIDVPDELFRPADWPVIEIELDAEMVQRVPIEVEAAEAPA